MTTVSAIVLAGGASTRFAPYERYGKALVRIMGTTILGHTLTRLMGGFPASLTVVHPSIDGWRERLGEDHLDLTDVRFVEQKQPKGQADAILTAWTSINKPAVILVVNAQHFTAASVLPRLLQVCASRHRSVVLVQKTDTPWKYGIVETQGDAVIRVVEKPAAGTEPSSLRIVGVYCLTREAIETIASAPQSEYQLEEGLDRIAKQGKLSFHEVKEDMPSLKYPWDLLFAKHLLLADTRYVDSTAFVHPTAILEDAYWIGPRAVVGAFSLVRGGAVLEDGSELERYVDAKNVLVGRDTHVHSGFIGDSVIGERCRIGAGFITANRRFDRRNILIEVKGKKVDTGMSSLGAFIGDDVSIGIHCGTMPGTIIESGVVVMPGEIAKGTVKLAGE